MLLGLMLGISCKSSEEAPEAKADDLPKQLSSQTFDSTLPLGPHRMEGSLTLTDTTPSRTLRVEETYSLRWESWKRYAYRITKDDHTTFDVTVVGDVAYQARRPGKIRARQNLYDFHFYLQQTWNLWASATRPFGDNIQLRPSEQGEIAGRAADRFEISLTEAGQLTQGRGVLQTVLVAATGHAWLDRATRVPLEVSFSGQYKTIHPSRVPGRAPQETQHDIALRLSRSGFGEALDIAAPDVVEGEPTRRERPAQGPWMAAPPTPAPPQ